MLHHQASGFDHAKERAIEERVTIAMRIATGNPIAHAIPDSSTAPDVTELIFDCNKSVIIQTVVILS
jgi:hypothetical protein